jgi:hypothetical protein
MIYLATQRIHEGGGAWRGQGVELGWNRKNFKTSPRLTPLSRRHCWRSSNIVHHCRLGQGS